MKLRIDPLTGLAQPVDEPSVTVISSQSGGGRSSGGGGGAVDSVNGQTGVVVLDTDDVNSVTNKRYVTDANLVTLGNTSGVNTGDQTITLTGDVTGSGTGSFSTTLASIVSADTVGDSTHIPIITYDAKGRITATSTATISASGGAEDFTYFMGLY